MGKLKNPQYIIFNQSIKCFVVFECSVYTLHFQICCMLQLDCPPHKTCTQTFWLPLVLSVCPIMWPYILDLPFLVLLLTWSTASSKLDQQRGLHKPQCTVTCQAVFKLHSKMLQIVHHLFYSMSLSFSASLSLPPTWSTENIAEQLIVVNATNLQASVMICIANSTYNYIGAESWSTLPCIMGTTFQIPFQNGTCTHGWFPNLKAVAVWHS